MHAGQATAVRRSMYAGAALAATLLAHVAASGGLDLTRYSPVAWGMLLVLALLTGRRTGAFRARGPGSVMVRLLAGQAILHVVLVTAPWAVGVGAHHADPVLSTRAAIAHALAALALGVLAMRGERLLAAAIAIADTVRGFVRAGRRPRAPRGLRIRRTPATARCASMSASGAHRTRGPPAAVILTA